MTIEKIETKTQEITLLITLVGVISILFTGSIYLHFSTTEMTSIAGNIGLATLDKLFSGLGYAAFILALSVFHLGQFIIKNVFQPRDFSKVYKRLGFKLLVELAIVFLIASILSVLQSYHQIDSRALLANGAGGTIGNFVGGNLYIAFGLYGALTILGMAIAISSIISGRLQLVSLFFALRDYSTKLAQFGTRKATELSQQFLKATEKHSQQLFIILKRKLHKFKNPDSELTDQIVDATQEAQAINTEDLTTIFDASLQGNLEKTIEQLKGQQQIDELIDEVEDLTEAEEAKPQVKKARKRNSKKAKASKNTDVESEAKEEPSQQEVELSEEELAAIEEEKKNIAVPAYKKRYNLPSIEHFEVSPNTETIKKDDLNKLCRELEERLASFDIRGEIIAANVGARLTMFEFQPAPGVRLSKVTGLTDDLALLLGAESIRILAPIPGKTTMGIEIPNKEPKMVKMGDMMKPLAKATKSMNLPIVVGKDVYNNTIIEDISKMPHMLVSGTTGSGKSVFINNLIVSLMSQMSPKKLRFLMIDPKMIELSPYNGIPHLLKPVVTDLDEAKDLLQWAQREMDRRYKAFYDLGARDIHSFNKAISANTKKFYERKIGRPIEWDYNEIPQIVIVVDELADLMITQGKEVEVPITRIAQKARAAGIHLVIATQRPSAEVVTGLIKTNFPTRVAFKVSSSVDSRTILDMSGAEKLLGNGDMLFMTNGKSTVRFQSAFISEEEVRSLVNEVSENG